jgi:hypothetical protein
MTGMSGTARALSRRDRELLAQRRHKAEGRLARERARNSGLAVAGFAALAVVMALGIHTNWKPANLFVHVTPADAESQTFARTRIGHILFRSIDGDVCEETRFDNDTGTLSNDKLVRCDDTTQAASSGEKSVVEDRALSVRGGFRRR